MLLFNIDLKITRQVTDSLFKRKSYRDVVFLNLFKFVVGDVLIVFF